MHALHMNFFGCKSSTKKSYEKHWKKYITSRNNLQKNNFYHLPWKFGQLQKYVQYNRFSLLHRYILHPHLLIIWHIYDHHICLCDGTYKCNFLTWTVNNTSKCICVSKKLQKCTLCLSIALGVNGPWRNNIKNT